MRISATSHRARVLAVELAWGSRGVQSYAPHRKLAARSAARVYRKVIGLPEKTERGIPEIFVDIVLC